jgi:tetratricopeptide (TPR) repeat protein
MTAKLERELAQMVEAGKSEKALEMAEEGLRQQPSSIVLLHSVANLHWMLGHNADAERVIAEARRHIGRENIDLIADLERRFCFGSWKSEVEAARQALRDRNSRLALEHLANCAALKGNEHYDGLAEYASWKKANRSRGSGDAAAPKSTLMQQTMRWVVGEEIEKAETAMRAGDHLRAASSFAAASVIEPDCGAAALGQARALFGQWRQKGGTPNLARLAALLEAAAQDPGLSEQISSLRRALGESSGGVGRTTR